MCLGFQISLFIFLGVPSGPTNLHHRDTTANSVRLAWEKPKLRRNQLKSDLENLVYKISCFICKNNNNKNCNKPCGESFQTESQPWIKENSEEIRSLEKTQETSKNY